MRTILLEEEEFREKEKEDIETSEHAFTHIKSLMQDDEVVLGFFYNFGGFYRANERKCYSYRITIQYG